MFTKPIYASIHNEIHRQIGELKRQGLKPCHIYLGNKASIAFYNECWYKWPCSYLGLPVVCFYTKLSGVFVSSY